MWKGIRIGLVIVVAMVGMGSLMFIGLRQAVKESVNVTMAGVQSSAMKAIAVQTVRIVSKTADADSIKTPIDRITSGHYEVNPQPKPKYSQFNPDRGNDG